jgi:hypothetical protein
VVRRLLRRVGTMMSLTPTLLDPFEVAGGMSPRPRLPSLMDPTEWFDRSSLPLGRASRPSLPLLDLSTAFEVEESNEAPPWTPEPVDRRWRARGWTDDE